MLKRDALYTYVYVPFLSCKISKKQNTRKRKIKKQTNGAYLFALIKILAPLLLVKVKYCRKNNECTGAGRGYYYATNDGIYGV